MSDKYTPDTDVHGDRLEAAAMALAEVDGGNFFAEPIGYRDDAREILAAADAVVTVEMVESAIKEADVRWNVAELRKETADPRTHSRAIAETVHRLYRGEQP